MVEARDTEPVTIKLGGLSLCVHGRERPSAQDYWDGNWLRARAECSYPGAHVEVEGGFLHSPELVRFRDAVAQLHATLDGAATLDCMEPYLRVELAAGRAGHMSMVVRITPDHLNQMHEFRDDTLDQSWLPAVLAGVPRDPRTVPCP